MSTSDPLLRFHPRLGAVIYDAGAQMGLAADMLRLFKVSSASASTFKRDIVSRDLGPCPDDFDAAARQVLDAYRSARQSRRKPYCEQCRRHLGSVDVSLCPDCRSLKCSCGSCSCVVSTRKRKAA